MDDKFKIKVNRFTFGNLYQDFIRISPPATTFDSNLVKYGLSKVYGYYLESLELSGQLFRLAGEI